jgi:UDP-N-acetylglucosamine 1-carboxyvinyltransferase
MNGGVPLVGTVATSGAKNSALPLLAATLMIEGETILTNVPNLMDVSTMVRMLKSLGLWAEYRLDNSVKIVNSGRVKHVAPYDLVTAMRASFFVAGPLLARTGLAKVPMPGGCSIGSRPIDIHLKGFKQLGATYTIEHGFVDLRAKNLKGNRVYLDFPSVGATENMMMAAALAEGESWIENAAQEPEIIDLANLINKAGGKVSGQGTSIIRVEGVTKLNGVTHRVIPDRVEAGTLMIAGAITHGDLTVTDLDVVDLEPLMVKMREAGVKIDVLDPTSVHISVPNGLHAVDVETLPFPGFPTDMQAQMMALLTLSKGTSVIKESIFENRFMHAPELMRMGADIKLDSHFAFVTGVESLSGAEVKITDLRAGAALILAGLAAEGTTSVYGLKHLKRGYDDLPGKLRSVGAIIGPPSESEISAYDS